MGFGDDEFIEYGFALAASLSFGRSLNLGRETLSRRHFDSLAQNSRECCSVVYFV